MEGVFGLVDGTHIALAGMSKELEACYVNRKGVHSINAQIVCNFFLFDEFFMYIFFAIDM